MTVRDISQARDPILRGSFAAMQRAAKRARQVAMQTDTAIVIRRNGKLVRITAEQLRAEQREAEASG